MSQPDLFTLPDRGVIALAGADAQTWLDNLITNDLTSLAPGSPSVFAGLLSPQGKLLFEFFVQAHGDGLLLETFAASIPALMKRLSLYKLRASVTLRDASTEWVAVCAPRPDRAGDPAISDGVIVSADPRTSRLWRGLVTPAIAATLPAAIVYHSARVGLGIAEAPHDYALGDVFPHEANFDQVHGVSFTKGCFVGQEVVARMQNKSVVRKRVVRVSAATDLVSGTDLTIGDAVIGKLGTVAGSDGLALLRIDRAAEALKAGQLIRAGSIPVTIDASALALYGATAANRPVHDL